MAPGTIINLWYLAVKPAERHDDHQRPGQVGVLGDGAEVYSLGLLDGLRCTLWLNV